MYLYYIKFQNSFKELCKMEMRHLFGSEMNASREYFLTEKYVDVNRSPFVKYCVNADVSAQSYDELLALIKGKNISYENYKVKFIDFSGLIEYEKGLKIEYEAGYLINGEAKLHEPEITIAVVKTSDRWLLGRLEKNNGIWHLHDERPRKYSNSLPSIMARAILNIAAPDIENTAIVDPCCGIGTVLLEAESMGMNIRGFDKNPKVVQGARKNLLFFDYQDIVKKGNIHNMTEKYDAAIVDLPYGIMSVTSSKAQAEIVKSSRKIAKKLLLVSIYDMSQIIDEAGFKIIDSCTVTKGKLTRYISLCE